MLKDVFFSTMHEHLTAAPALLSETISSEIKAFHRWSPPYKSPRLVTESYQMHKLEGQLGIKRK